MPDRATPDVNTADIAARVDSVLSRYRDDVLAGMRRALGRPGIEHARLMRYHLGWEDAAGAPIDAGAGKMLRPALCLLCCEAANGDATQAMPAAVAIELLHNFTLIHDDIEDHSERRHGRETLWRVAGMPQALNAGDGLFVIAQRTLLDLPLAPERVVEAAQLLNDACVTLCEGQYADLGFESRERVSRAEYEAMIGGKTAALLGASAAIGALAAGAARDAVQAFARCGTGVGLREGLARAAERLRRAIAAAPFMVGGTARFDTVEINNSFYRLPEQETFARWSSCRLGERERKRCSTA